MRAEQADHRLEHAGQAAGHPQQASPPATQAVPALSGHRVRDEFCLDDFYKLLQEHSKLKKNQMRDISEKRSFGSNQKVPRNHFKFTFKLDTVPECLNDAWYY